MTAAIPIIDCHQHFWRLGRGNYPWLEDADAPPHRYGPVAPLLRDYLPDDYRRDTAEFEIAGTVHMEAEWHPDDPVGETRWLHDLAEAEGLPSAIVGQAWFARDDIHDVLAGHADFPLVRAVRQKPTAAPSPEQMQTGLPGSMSDPIWRAGYGLLARYGLHYELQTRYWHLGEAAALARDFPDTTIVLNHAGVPEDRSTSGLSVWRAGMVELAEQPNVKVKISGIGEAGHAWSVARQRGVVRDIIRIFGVGRCMFASNFPVDRLVGSFATIFNGFLEITDDLSDSDRRQLFHGNAAETYRL
ncbi:MAG: amidohydrolase family protein [Rhodospirillaceae bacterium]|jgi:predicted TIM-barrel fold metal-dependent hydrolase|nr:amidohydrolase family protein [Rhodospirillaceae bacterium]MBT3491107.1 amidohydrolase family protein [Rhodospirillaceae bacterium]MBT3781845.1 amidohydrolase family protein [Rhodospirillaceae bacterium]MBT3975338.1 amidohydrolase family protein [Rhodospirillaceae bacterium]MBT4171021.1 amidohydrolase family protein [Rhodospirillaceae bacterium]